MMESMIDSDKTTLFFNRCEDAVVKYIHKQILSMYDNLMRVMSDHAERFVNDDDDGNSNDNHNNNILSRFFDTNRNTNDKYNESRLENKNDNRIKHEDQIFPRLVMLQSILGNIILYVKSDDNSLNLRNTNDELEILKLNFEIVPNTLKLYTRSLKCGECGPGFEPLAVEFIDLNNNEDYLIIGSQYGLIYIYKYNTKGELSGKFQYIGKIYVPYKGLSSCYINNNFTRIILGATTSFDCDLKVIKLSNNFLHNDPNDFNTTKFYHPDYEYCKLDGHSKSIITAKFVIDSNELVISTGNDGVCILWDVMKCDILQERSCSENDNSVRMNDFEFYKFSTGCACFFSFLCVVECIANIVYCYL